jgi:hypothetical protein
VRPAPGRSRAAGRSPVSVRARRQPGLQLPGAGHDPALVRPRGIGTAAYVSGELRELGGVAPEPVRHEIAPLGGTRPGQVRIDHRPVYPGRRRSQLVSQRGQSGRSGQRCLGIQLETRRHAPSVTNVGARRGRIGGLPCNRTQCGPEPRPAR